MRKNRAVIASLTIALAMGMAGRVQANLVTNGSFETTTNGNGQLGYNTNATGWTVTGYNFIFASGTADTSGAVGVYGGLQLWGPNNGSSNGLPASSPDGGNFVAADGAFEQGPISQTLNGLTPGHTYQVGFYWAGAQQKNFNGTQTEQWQVSFGSDTQSTVVLENTSHGFTGWRSQVFNFTANSASEGLSFLAVGTPTGVPPFSLLDGVSVNDVTVSPLPAPEPSTLLVAGMGLLVLCGIKLRRRAMIAAV